MAPGDRHRVHGLLAQFVGELPKLAGLEAAQVSRRFNEVEERGLRGLGHEERLRQRMGGGNLTGWLRFNQPGRQDQTKNTAKSLTHLAFSAMLGGTCRSATAFCSIPRGERVASWHHVRIGRATSNCRSYPAGSPFFRRQPRAIASVSTSSTGEPAMGAATTTSTTTTRRQGRRQS